MAKLEDAVVARFEHSGKHFELLVDPDLAWEAKKGFSSVELDDLLAVHTVFSDAKKGTDASPEDINKVFGTSDFGQVVHAILIKGEVQLTTDQRRAMKEKRTREVVAWIAMNAINPQTGAPHPPARIETVLVEIKANIDAFKSAEEQVQSLLPELKRKIPISIEKIKIAVKIGAEHSGRASAYLHRYSVSQEQWQPNGSLIAIIEMPAGMRPSFIDGLNKITHGQAESKPVDEKTQH